MDIQQRKKTLQRDLLSKPSEDVCMELGAIYYREGNFEKAAEMFRRTTKFNSKSTNAYNLLAVCLSCLKKYEEAEIQYLKAIELDGNYTDTHNNYGLLLRDLKRYEEAETHHLKAIELNGNDARIHSNYGLLLRDLKRYEEAEAQYLKAIELAGNDAYAHSNYGNLLKDLKRYEEAETQYLKALELDGNHVNAHNNYGLLLRDMKRYEEAEIQYLKAIEIDGNYVDAHNNYGNLLKDLNRYEEAETHYLKAIELDGNHVDAHSNYGNLLRDLNRYEEAETQYLKAIEIDENHINAHSNYGILLLGRERYREAESCFLKTLDIDPEPWRPNYLLAALYKETNQIEKFKEYYIIAARHNPALRDSEYEKQEDIKFPPETLTLSNFGPITQIDIELKRFTLFIGKQGQGKSTIAKIIAILGNMRQFLVSRPVPPSQDELQKKFTEELANYGLSSYLRPDSYLCWQYSVWRIEYKQGVFSYSAASFFNCPTLYIPADRAFTVLAAGAFQNLLLNRVPISQTLLHFGATFEKARAYFTQHDIPLLGLTYRFNNGIDYVAATDSPTALPLRESASSHQAVVPMYLTIEYLAHIEQQTHYVIEEPELNLFPTAQKELIEFIVERGLFNRPNNQVIVTTHSPYLLTSINNLLQAMMAFLRRPESDEEINRIVPQKLWMMLSETAAYHIDNGTARNILNEEYYMITDSGIDSVSDEISEAFSLLTDIIYLQDQ